MMQIWRGNTPPTRFSEGCAVTIGNFDGVHLGHKHILMCLKEEAKKRNLATILITFEPSPREFFSQKNNVLNPPQRVSSLKDKLSLLAQTECLDGVWILSFDQQFAQQTAQSFIDDTLEKALNTRFLLIGDDFCFGAKRQGNIALLKQQSYFETQETPSILVQDRRASSSDIRHALKDGNFEQANTILGHDFFISGTVIRGKQLARQLGYPTANIQVKDIYYPLTGVFAVEVTGAFGQKGGVANLGWNPTVSETAEQKLEVHLFDWQGDLYDQEISINFLKKIRDELKFPDLNSLTKQIQQDGLDAQAYLLSLGRKYD